MINNYLDNQNNKKGKMELKEKDISVRLWENPNNKMERFEQIERQRKNDRKQFIRQWKMIYPHIPMPRKKRSPNKSVKQKQFEKHFHE